MTDRIFVYGTLRQDLRDSMFHMLARDARFVGRGRVRGRLFYIDEYPGLVHSSESGAWVYGEVYALDNPTDTLARLDEYEGCGPTDVGPREFERVERRIVLDTGASVNAWVYIYKGSTSDKQEILSGDFFKEALLKQHAADGTD